MRFALALVLTGCASLEPTYGPYHVDQPDNPPPADMDATMPPPDPGSDAALSDGAIADVHSDVHVDGDAPPVSTGISFRRDVRPLMDRAANDPTGKGCKNCHYSTQASHQGIDLGGLDMATLGALREGGGSTGRRIIVAGKPDESGIIQKLRGTYPYGTRMPKNGPPFWSDADIKVVSDWIAQGAKGADDE